MPDYLLTFRIHSDATYQRRYSDLIAALDAHATLAWDSDTSAIAFRSTSGIDRVGADIKAALNGSTDRAVIREIGVKSTRYINTPGKNFLSFFPEAKKL